MSCKAPKHIVHLVPSFNSGGLEQVICNLIRATSNNEVSHSIISLTSDIGLHTQIEDLAPLYCLDKQPGNDLSSHLRLYKLLKRLKPTALNTYNFGTLEYHIAALLAGVKRRVHSMHGFDIDPSQGDMKKWQIFCRLMSYFIHRYIVVSPALRNWSLDKSRIPEKKVQLIFNGVDTAVFKPKSKLDQHFTFITVGRLHPVKNQALLIRSFHQLITQHPDVTSTRLQIIGDGELKGELLALRKELDLEDRVEFLGYRSDSQEFLGQSHVFVLPSHFEAMPMSALEALACETPAICTKVGGVEYLIDESVGWLIDDNSQNALVASMYEAYSNTEQRLEKAQRGKNMVQNKYSLKNMTDEYLAVYLS